MSNGGQLIAVLDTNVLLPSSLRNMLFYAVDLGLFWPRWSTEILSELHRNLVNVSGLTEDAAARRIAIITGYFPDAEVTVNATRIQDLTNDPKDRHVLAAAVESHATVIVTQNTKDFPATALGPHGIVAWTADEFLVHLLRTNQAGMLEAVKSHASKLRNPPMTPVELLERLALHAPEFARLAAVML